MNLREMLKSIPLVRKLAELLRYAVFQVRVTMAEADDRKHPKDSHGVSIPPARLRHRVHGDLSRERFVQVGETVARDLRNLTAQVGRDWSTFTDVLDFGCGSARVMRSFLGSVGNARYSGTDIDAELVDWCRKEIPGVDWKTNGFMPPTTYADGAFDLVYAISVFTHLDEDYQNAWLAELQRITRPGAILILTVHGEPVIGRASMTEAQRAELESKGFLFVKGTTGKLKLDGLPDFYQTAYHKQDYIRKVWGKHFEVLCQAPEGINQHQDAVVLRRR